MKVYVPIRKRERDICYLPDLNIDLLHEEVASVVFHDHVVLSVGKVDVGILQLCPRIDILSDRWDFPCPPARVRQRGDTGHPRE